MPKRTLSSSPCFADQGMPGDADNTSTSDEHVLKFVRLSASPSPSIAASTDMSVASDPSPTVDALGKPIQCLLPPHSPLTFATVAQFEAHLYSHHTNRCTECRANFPSSHLLGLHQAESHDPLVAGRRDRGEKTFSCLLPGCEKVCLNGLKRKMHMVDKHGFRKDYDWSVVERGIDGKSSMLKGGAAPPQRSRKMSLTGNIGERGVKRSVGFQRRTQIGGEGSATRPRGPDTKPAETEDDVGQTKGENLLLPASSNGTSSSDVSDAAQRMVGDAGQGIDSLTKSMSALRFIPPSVSRKKTLLANIQSTG